VSSFLSGGAQNHEPNRLLLAACRENPKMCVISGHALILFDGKYSLRAEPFEGGEESHCVQLIELAGERPPDGNVTFVLFLKPFPGTLISMKFNLKEKMYATAV